MSRYDVWVMLLLFVMLAACIPFDLPKPPPDFSPCPSPPQKESVVKSPSPSATPNKSALEYELEDVRSDLDSCRRVIREFSCEN